jgi:hypothetical protein
MEKSVEFLFSSSAAKINAKGKIKYKKKFKSLDYSNFWNKSYPA